MKKSVRVTLTICAAISAMGLCAFNSKGQTVIGSFQGAGDGNGGAYWQETPTGTFAQNVVPGYNYSLEENPAGSTTFGNPNIEVYLTGSQITAFNSDGLLSFTLSAPTAGLTSGYYQLYNIYVQAGAGGSYSGYHNLISGGSGGTTTWSALNTAGDVTFSGDAGSTGNNQNGMPNFYFYNGAEALFSETVTINYSSLLASDSVLENDVANGLGLGFQFGQNTGTPLYINNVELAPVPEPASMALLGLGGVLGAVVMRRRKI